LSDIEAYCEILQNSWSEILESERNMILMIAVYYRKAEE
jgi:hypothetical protein